MEPTALDTFQHSPTREIGDVYFFQIWEGSIETMKPPGTSMSKRGTQQGFTELHQDHQGHPLPLKAAPPHRAPSTLAVALQMLRVPMRALCGAGRVDELVKQGRIGSNWFLNGAFLE